MRGSVALGLLVVLGGCGGVATTAGRSPAPSAAGVSSPISDVASPVRTAESVVPIATVDFSCRLPVYSYPAGGGGAADAFIEFPGRSTVAANANGTYYDPAVSRWLPVFQRQVAPDGLRYAFTEGWGLSPTSPARVHVVDAATGNDIRVVPMPDMQPYFVLDFTAAGIDLGIGYEGRAPGVWTLDPATGHITKVSESLYPPDAVWTGAVDPRDPNPARSSESGQPQVNRIDRHDPSGATTTWFYLPGHGLLWAPFAGNGAILVQAYWMNQLDPTQGGVEYWLVTGPNRSTRLAAYRYPESGPIALGFGSTAVSDGHGIWLSGQQGLYLVTPAGSILRVLESPVYPAGACN